MEKGSQLDHRHLELVRENPRHMIHGHYGIDIIAVSIAGCSSTFEIAVQLLMTNLLRVVQKLCAGRTAEICLAMDLALLDSALRSPLGEMMYDRKTWRLLPFQELQQFSMKPPQIWGGF